MSNVTTSLGQAYREMRASGKTFAVIVFIAVVEALIHLWTITHNIPLLAGGVDTELRPFGFVAAITGEVFSLGMLLFAFRLSGGQRIVALLSHAVMFLILLANTAINYNDVRGAPMTSEWIVIYKTWGAPTLMFLIAGTGCWLLAHQDPAARLRDAEMRVEQLRLDAEIAAVRATEAEMQSALDEPANEQVIRAGAQALVARSTRALAGQFGGDGHGTRSLNVEVPIQPQASPRPN